MPTPERSTDSDIYWAGEYEPPKSRLEKILDFLFGIYMRVERIFKKEAPIDF